MENTPQENAPQEASRNKMFSGIGVANLIGADEVGRPKDAAHYGRATLVAGVVTVADTTVTATSIILAHRQTVAGTSGGTLAITRTAGTNFTITSQAAGVLTTQAADTSVVGYLVIP